jgi:asparaginyl-tRNA synthetase
VGCSASLRGTLVDSPGKGQAKEFRAAWVEVLGQSDAAVSLSSARAQSAADGWIYRAILSRIRSRESRRRSFDGTLTFDQEPVQPLQCYESVVRWRGLHTGTSGYVSFPLSRQNIVLTFVLWQNNEFLQVQAPLITSSDCEGAGEVFRVESGSPPIPVAIPSTPDSTIPPPPPPPPPLYLTVSSQLHLEAIAASFAKVYTLSPAFRAEKSDTARHLQEFYMLEAEVSFLPTNPAEGLSDIMQVSEDVVRSTVAHLLEHNASDLEFFDAQNPGLVPSLQSLLSSPPFPRITYTEAITILSTHALAHPNAFTFTPIWGNSIATEHEKWLAESYAHGPIFVTNYPTPLKPFYMLANPLPLDPSRETSACFDLLVPRLGELAGGSLREHRHDELLESMQRNGVQAEEYEWYTELRKYGTTRHGGFGMGWERLVAFVTGLDNVRDCIAFPRAAEGSRF